MSSLQQVKVKVLCPNKPVADVAAHSVLLPSMKGYIEVLPDHAAMISELDVGELIVKKTAGENLKYFISGGYVQVQNNEVVVLADVIEAADQIDRERLKKAEERADKRLVEKNPEIDIYRALEAKKRATARREFISNISLNS